MPCNPVFQFSNLITAAGRKTTDTREEIAAKEACGKKIELWFQML
jgi:hypothetical protein